MALPEILQRTRCVIDGSPRLEPLHRFPEFPVYMGCTDDPPGTDPTHDMAWAICRDCGCIQLTELVPPPVLYARSHNSGLVGGLWARHHEAFAEFILEHGPASVLEVGAGHGILSIQVHRRRPEVDWVAVEPNPTPQPGCRARFIRGFFPGDVETGLSVDAVVHSHFLEHLYAPREFFADLGRFLAPGKLLLFSVPNMRVMLERKYTNCLNFEHSYLADEAAIERLLAEAGFATVDRRAFLDDHSLFYAARRMGGVGGAAPAAPAPADAWARNRAAYEDYLRHHADEVARLNAFMAAHDGEVFLFGAHVFSQYLFAFGLDQGRITAVLDNDRSKQGRRLSGSRLAVASPEVLRAARNPAVILKAGVYNQEIRDDIVARINPETRFV